MPDSFSFSDAIGGATSIFNALNSQKAANSAAGAIANLQYQPIDLKALQEQARNAAMENAKNSLALEQQLQPDLAAARSGSQKQVAENLKLGGNLSPDVANAVTSGGIGAANSAGLYGGSGPITAAQLGLTAQSLKDQRLNQALQLSQANPLPVAGLDPGALASATVSQNNAQNQFALDKMGAINRANQSQANAKGSTATTFGSVLGGLAKSIFG